MKNSERIAQLDNRMDSLENDLGPIWARLNRLEAEGNPEGSGPPSEYVIAAARFAIDTLKDMRGYLNGNLEKLTNQAIHKLEDSLAKL